MPRDDKQELTFRRGLPYSWQGPPRYPKAVSGVPRRFFVPRFARDDKRTVGKAYVTQHC
jgi:hypothetical protein